MKLDFSHFEPLAGSRPTQVVARHPAGGYLALETTGTAEAPPELGVWEAATGMLVWADEGVAALAWTTDGAQLLLCARMGAPAADVDADADADVGTPGRFERRSWPADELLDTCTFTLPQTLWPQDLWVESGGRLAAVRWVDQGGSGWEPIVLSPAGDMHLAGAGFTLDSGVAVETHPVLSPSGRYAVSGYQTLHATTRDGFEVPRQRGRFEVGRIVVMDLHARTFRSILVDDAVPAKLHGTAAGWVDLPVFLDETHFKVMLPTGATRVFSALG